MSDYEEERRLTEQIATEYDDKHSLFRRILGDVDEIEIVLENYLNIITQLRDVSGGKISEKRAIKIIMGIVDWKE